jgi:hypothetical protein
MNHLRAKTSFLIQAQSSLIVPNQRVLRVSQREFLYFRGKTSVPLIFGPNRFGVLT